MNVAWRYPRKVKSPDASPGLNSYALKANHAIGVRPCPHLTRPKAVHYSIESERGFIYGGSHFVTARERSEKVITLKELPQVVFSRTGYIYIPFGRSSATSIGA